MKLTICHMHVGRNIKQKTLTALERALVGTLAVILVFSDLTTIFHLPFVPNIDRAAAVTGDYSNFTETSGTESVTSSGLNITWDTRDAESNNIALDGGDSIIDLVDGGKYLVLYNAWTQKGASGGADRRSFESYLSLNGGDLEYGRGASYFRDANGIDVAAYAAGGSIIEAASGDDLRLHIRRDDTNGSAGSEIRPNTNGVNVLKLDDNFDYLRVHKSTRSADISGNTTFTNVTWDTSDEVDTGSFAFSPTSADITLKGDAGDKFLVTTNVRLNQDAGSDVRQNYEMRLTIDGSEVDGSRTTGYIRGNANGHGTVNSTLVYTGIIEKTSSSDQVFNIEVRRESVTGAATDIVADETALSIVKLPDNANYVMLTSTTTSQTLATTRTALQWDHQLEVDGAYTHSTSSNNARINFESGDDYLFFSTAYTERTSGTTRNAPRIEWRLDGTTVIDYGGHGSFNRGDQGTDDAFTSGSSGGALLRGITNSQYLEVVHSDETGNTPNATFEPRRISVQGVDLSSLSQIDVNVTQTGTQKTETSPDVDNFETGASFAISTISGSRNVTNITISESGTINAEEDIDNIKIYYDLDTTAPYNCSSETYQGNESQFGNINTNGFSNPDGSASFADSVGISPTQSMCIYVILDVESGARDQDTINVSIDNPSNDVLVSNGTVGPSVAVGGSDVTTITDPEITLAHYHWRNDDGDETGATSATGGVENTPALAFSTTSPQRLRMSVYPDGTGNSTMNLRLEYAEKAGSCSTATGWTDVASVDGAWDMYDSSHITNGDNTTNIPISSGGVSDPAADFKAQNSGLLDTTSETDALNISYGSERAIAEFGTSTITNGATSTIMLENTYTDPIVVASVRYSRSTETQRTVRVTEKTSTSFDILVDNYNSTLSGNTTIDYVVAEAGEWDVLDGSDSALIFASSTSVSPSAVAANSITGDPGGPTLTYPTSFNSAPTVAASVTSYNDPDWLFASVYGGSDVTNPPTSFSTRVFLNENFESDGHSTSEDIDVIAFEQKNGAYNAIEFDFTTSDGANVTHAPQSVSLTGFSSAPVVTLVQGLTTNGANGGYAMIDTDNPTTVDDATVTIDEEGTNADRTHGGAEEVAVIAFSEAGNLYVDEIVGKDFVELEYSIEATDEATEGVAYCFRLTDSGTPLRNYDVYPEATLSADVMVSATGTQVATLDESSANNYIGGTFSITENVDASDITSITVTEAGSIDAQNSLENIKLYYDLDTTAPYDCTSESYTGIEPQYGGTVPDGFSGENGSATFADNVSISTTSSMCIYVIFDITASATDGETVDVQITNPSNDVEVNGGTVGPGSVISIDGSTTVSGPFLTQTGYHFREDDGTESNASSATGGENVPVDGIAIDQTSRVRFAVSNDGSNTSSDMQYGLEYGLKQTSCSAVSNWQDVDTGPAFEMANTSNLIDGDDTTNIATTTGGITDPNNTFLTLNGGQKEADSKTASFVLTNTEFAELEYAVTPTDLSAYETTYCFRVTADDEPLSSYTVYPELTTQKQLDFSVQRGTETVTGTSTTLVAEVDYTAPSASSSAFIRITNTKNTGSGSDNLGAPNDADNITAYIEDPWNIEDSVTIARPSTASDNTRVSWEIIEYVGISGADNEMVVRGQGTIAYGASDLFATGTQLTNIADDQNVVVFITGQRNPDTGRENMNTGLSISSWSAATDEPVFQRGDADGVAAEVSYAVVEFTGANWKTQRVEHQYGSTGITETEPITAITAISQAFLHTQKLSGDELYNLDETGHEVWLSSIGSVSFRLESGATNPSDQRSVAWVIENTQTGSGAMNVYQSNGTIAAGAVQPEAFVFNIGAPVDQFNASIWANNRSTGAGDYHPRAFLGARIISDTQYELWKSDEGQDQAFRVEVVEWPITQLAIRQNYYRFYTDNDALDPVDPWPDGPIDLGENTAITDLDEPLGESERIRVRMTLSVNNASFVENTKSFKLQYARRVSTCSAVTGWNDLGDPGSGEIWRGYDATPIDGTELSTTTLKISIADVAGTYEEENNTVLNPQTADIGEDVEYDWVIENNGAIQKSSYCFRMIESNGTQLDGYQHYPTIRTSGFTPVNLDWGWYDDENNVTPNNALAATNTSPIDIANDQTVKLRVVVGEIEGADGQNVKYNLQYSEYSDFRDGGTTLTSTSTCEENSLWCYADGAGDDNATITEAVLASADACSGGIGAGCGTHNEAEGLSSQLSHGSFESKEFEFTLQHAGARTNAVYYFRLYDETNGSPVPASSSLPSLVTEGAQVEFVSEGISSGFATEGVTSDITTTPSSIPFGNIAFGNDMKGIHRFEVNTNGTEGYRVLVYSRNHLTNDQGSIIPPFAASNSAPVAWESACTTELKGCFGYHTGDDTLSDGSVRFSPDNTYAALETELREIAYSSSPESNETVDVVYRLQITDQQEPGDYETNIVYIIVPIF